ncbi:hypothetical protein [Shewanella sp. UCD-KL12]|uniref:hypothetical protein n=1 Tax=Shewanella sp. UCD-KL12 TaxID=1917163 RepID=UPI000970EFBE|nr:hypothetical protein [Shewanella sp. UCD-KL12]
MKTKKEIQHSLLLIDSCIRGLHIAIDMVSKADAVIRTYNHLGVDKGSDYSKHEDSLLCAKYIMDQLHEFADNLPDAEEGKKEREERRASMAVTRFVSSELKRTLSGITTTKSQLEVSTSMYEALSQLNLDEDGYRYKFAIEGHITTNVGISDAIGEFLEPLITKAFKIRKARLDKIEADSQKLDTASTEQG